MNQVGSGGDVEVMGLGEVNGGHVWVGLGVLGDQCIGFINRVMRQRVQVRRRLIQEAKYDN